MYTMEKIEKMVHHAVGMRTMKTALAVTLSLLVVEQYGLSTAKVVFATIGAMSAVAPTVKSSIEACLTQIFGVIVGAVLAMTMIAFAIPGMLAVGFGIIFILAAYQWMHTKLLPVLPCLILVNISLSLNLEGLSYAVARLWDTMIGLTIGLAINLAIFPYDNGRIIRQKIEALDETLVFFLEDLFDGDGKLPDNHILDEKIDAMKAQLNLLSEQQIFHRKKKKQELKTLEHCEQIAQALVCELEVLRNIQLTESCRLNERSHEALLKLGAKSLAKAKKDEACTFLDQLTSYHVMRILKMREELKKVLKEVQNKGGMANLI